MIPNYYLHYFYHTGHKLADGTLAVSGEGIFVQAPQLFNGLGAGSSPADEAMEIRGTEK